MKAKNARLALVLGMVSALVAAAAQAQEYVPINEAAQPRTDPNPFLLAAYGFIWVAVLAYVVVVARGLRSAREEVEELRKKVSNVSAPGRS